MFGFSRSEMAVFKKLTTPEKIQDFVNRLPANFQKSGETCFSPLMVLKKQRAQCMEGAMLAAVALRLQGFPPLVMDLKTTDDDEDHVVAVFQVRGLWGAISKTNHGVLRYREPIYRNVRELAISYFHEYFLDDGRKTLRSYSLPVDLSRFDTKGWMTDTEPVWYVPEYVDGVQHFDLLPRAHVKKLRKADPVEIRAGKLLEWKK